MIPPRNAFKAFLLKVALCLPAMLLPLPAPAAQTDFSLHARYRHEESGSDRDTDLSSHLDFRWSDPGKQISNIKISGWGNLDLSDDDFSSDYNRLNLTEAYVDARAGGDAAQLRMGRQRIGDTGGLTVDGAAATFFYPKSDYRLFAGVPVSWYSGRSADLVLGAGARMKPWWRTSAALDLYFFRDGDHWFDAATLRINQVLPWESSNTYFRTRIADRRVRDLYLKLSAFFRRLNMAAGVDYYLQPDGRWESEDTFSNSFSRYGGIFGKEYGFSRLGVHVQLYPSKKWSFSAGFTIRRVRDRGTLEYRWANVNSNIMTAGITRSDLFMPGLSLTISANRIETGDERFHDVSGALEYEYSKAFSLSSGITFTGYRFGDLNFPDTLNGQTSVYDLDDHMGSRILFLDLDMKFDKRHRIVLRGAFEDNDGPYDDTTVLTINYRFHFFRSG